MENRFNKFALLLFIPIYFSCAKIDITEQMVRKAEEDRYSAIIQADTTKLNQFLAEEFIYNQPTGAVADRQSYALNVVSGRPAIRSASIDNLDIQPYHNIAISTGTVSIEAEMAGERVSANLRFMNTWIWRDGRLQLAARQSAFIESESEL